MFFGLVLSHRLSRNKLLNVLSVVALVYAQTMPTSLERKQFVEQNVPGVSALIHQIQLRDHGDCPVTCNTQVKAKKPLWCLYEL